MSWSREQVEVLIDTYQLWPCLYAIRNVQYNNKHARQSAFKAVEQAVKRVRATTTMQEIKTKFQGLKAIFLTEYKKVETSKSSGTGEDDVYQPTLWYYDKLMFILDHTIPRQSIDSIDDIIYNATDEVKEEISDQISSTPNTQLYDEDNDVTYEISGMVHEGELELQPVSVPTINVPVSRNSTPLSSRSSSVQPSQPSKNRKRGPEDTVLQEASGALGLLTKRLDNTTHEKAKSREDIFGQLIAARMKNITNPKLKNDAEVQILQLLNNLADH